jgi:uncharacterized protein (UPF0333 family)
VKTGQAALVLSILLMLILLILILTAAYFRYEVCSGGNRKFLKYRSRIWCFKS